MNQLFYGDNLTVMRDMVADESADLIYLDPPFNSKRGYNIIHGAQEQERAFDDVWVWRDTEEGVMLEEMYTGKLRTGKLAEVMQALDALLGRGGDVSGQTFAYLVNMAVRLQEMRRILKPTGSIYLHCDPTASHYLKLIMDVVFGPENFRNEIIWKRTSAHTSSKKMGSIHDVILYYTKSATFTWNVVFTPYDKSYTDSFYRHTDPDGRRFRLSDLTGLSGSGYAYEFMGVTRKWRYPEARMYEKQAEGRILAPKKQGGVPAYKRYLDEMPGVSLQDVWTDIPPLQGVRQAECLGYPTQKPVTLLERIISASSNPGDTVFDPFCGCGTTVAAASKLGRNWIGIDIAPIAIEVIRDRLHAQGVTDFIEDGVPGSVEGARNLFAQSPHSFERWAVKFFGGYKSGNLKGGDKGVDGRAHFTRADGSRGLIILSVKGGSGNLASPIRDLGHVVTREKADMGVLLCFDKATKGVQAECASSGVYKHGQAVYPTLQVITVEDLFTGLRHHPELS